MEGGGETMVAIIQGLRDAGLAVTLMSGTRLQNSQKSRKKPAATKTSSVETSTARPQRTVSAQICDAHYASSYQVAHCHYRPTSPSQHLPEFPVQRRCASRTKGNFKQVGRFGCGETHFVEYKKERGRGSLYRSPSPAFPSDSFVESLRKYPLPAGRSASTELVQRLLNYTQSKHLSRNNTRSMRSLASRPARPSRSPKHKKASKQASRQPSKLPDKASKNVQTYTRIVNEAPLAQEKPRAKRSNRKNANVGNRPRVDQLSETYNYLGASISGRRSYTGHSSEVRYLNDVKRYIKETIRQLVSQDPIVNNHLVKKKSGSREKALRAPVSFSIVLPGGLFPNLVRTACPKVRSRYDEHRRLCHKQTDSTTSPSPNEHDVYTEPTKDEAPTYIERSDRGLGTEPSFGICPKASRRYQNHRRLYHEEDIDDNEHSDSEEGQAKMPGYCRAPPATKRSRSFSPCHPGDCPHKYQETSEFEDEETGDTSGIDGRRVSEDDIEPRILAWLFELPVFINNTPENQDLHLEMAQDLIGKLKALKGREDYDDRAMEEIQSFLDNLPVPAPKDDNEEEIDYEEEINEPIKIREIIANWLDCINLDIRTKKGKLMSKQMLLDKFVARLEPIVDRNGTRNELKTEIMKMLPKSIEEDLGSNLQDEINQHADNLADKLYDIILRKENRAKRAEERKNDIKDNQIISEWLENIEDVPEEIKEQNRKKAEKADSKLNQLILDHATDDVMAIEINKFLDSLPDDEIPLTSKQKTELTNNFINAIKPAENVLNSMTQQEKHDHAKRLLNNLVLKPNSKYKTDQPVSNWLENASNIPEEIKIKNQNLANTFDKKLQQLKSQNVDNGVIQDEIKEFLASLPDKGISLTPSQQIQLAKNLVNQIKPKSDRVSDQPATDWLENAPNIPEDKKKQNKNLVQNFDNKLQQLRSQNADDDVIEKEIDEFVKSLPKTGILLTPSQQSQLAKNLVNQTIPKSNIASHRPATDWLDNAPNVSAETKKKNRNLVQNFDKKLQQLKSQNADDDVIEEEIEEFIKSLPEKGISLTPSQQSRLVKNLVNETKPKSNRTSNRPAADWLENAPNISEEIKKKNRNLVENFDKNLQQLISQNADDDVIEEEIEEFVKSLPKTGISLTPSQQIRLVKNLVNETKPKSNRTSNRPVGDWLENAPNISAETKKKNRNLVQNFDKKLQQLKSQNADDDVIEEEIEEFVKSLPEKGISLTPSQQNRLVKNLVNETKPKSNRTSNRPAAEWLENAPNVSAETKKKNRNLVQNFDKKLQQLKSHNADDDVIEEEIEEFVKSLPENGISLTPSQQSRLVKNFVNETIPKPINNRPISNRPAAEWLENALNVSEETKKKNRNLVQNFDKKLQQLKSQNADDDVIEEEIEQFVKSLPEKGISLTPSQQNRLVKNLVNETKPKSNKISNRPAADWLENAPNVSAETKKKNRNLVQNFDKKLQQLKSQNADDDVIEEEIEEFVKSLPEKGISLSPSQQNRLVKNLVNETKPKSNRTSNRPAAEWLENAPNVSAETKRKNRNLVQNFDKKLQQLKSQNADDDVIEEEIEEFVKSLPEKGISLTPSQQNRLFKNLVNETKPKSNRTSNRPAAEWLENAPNVSEEIKKKNRNLVQNFDKNLQQLKSQNADDDVIEEEIEEFVKSLPKTGISLTPSQQSRLVKNLVNERKSKSNRVSNRPAAEWFEDAPNVLEEMKKQNRNLVQNIVNKLQQLKSQNVDVAVIEEEINDFLKSLPKKGILLTPLQRTQLANDLVNQTKPKSDRVGNRPATTWLENAPNVSEDMKKKNRNLVQNFDKRLQRLKSQNADDGVIEEEVEEFVKSLPKTGISLTPSQQSRLAKNLVNETKSNLDRIKNRPVAERFEDAPNVLEEMKKQNRNLVQNIVNKLQQLKSQNVDDAVIEEEINDFLKSLPKKGILLTPLQRTQLANDLVNQSKSKPDKNIFSKVNNLSTAADWLENAPNVSEDMKKKNKTLIHNFDKKLQQLKAQNADDDVIEEEIKDFVKSLPKKGILLTPSEQNELTKNLVNQTIPNSDRESNRPASDWLENAPNISQDKKKQNRNLFPGFDKKLQKLKSQNADDDVIEETIEEFVKSLPKTGISLTTSQQSQLAKNLANQTKPKLDSLSTRAARNWLENAPSVSEDMKKKNRNLVQNFDKTLQQLKSQNADDDVIKEKVKEFVKALPKNGILLTPLEQNDLAENLVKQTIPKSDRESNRPVSDWLENAPNISQEKKKQNRNLVQNFDKKLQRLKSQNADKDVIEETIKEFVNLLPKTGISLTPSQQSRLVKNLVNETKPKSNRTSNRPAADWLENAPNISEEIKEKNRNLVQNFDKNLQQLKSQNADDDVIEEEIEEFVKSLPKTGISLTPSQQSRLVKNLVNETKPKSNRTSNRPAADWLENAPNVSAETKNKNKNLVQAFDNKLQQLVSRNADNDVIEDEIQEFVKSLPKTGIFLTPAQQSELAKNLVNEIKPKSNSVINRPATNWLENAPNISQETKKKNANLVQTFDKKLEQLKSQNADDDVIKEEIGEFVKSLPKTGISLTPSQQSRLVKNLINETKPKVDRVSARPAADWLENVQNVSEETKKKNKNLIHNFDKKLQQLKSQNADDDVIEDEIKDFLKSLPNKGILLTPSQQSQLSKNLLNQIKPQSDQESKQPATDWLENASNISEETKNRNRNSAKNFDNKLQQLISQNADNDVIKEEIEEFVKSLPRKGFLLGPLQQCQLIKELLNQTKLKPDRSNPIRNDSISPDLIENVPNLTEEIKKKNKNLLENFVKKLKDLPSKNVSDDILRKEIKKFVDTLPKNGVSMSPKEKNLLITDILNDVKSESKQRKRWDESEQNEKKNKAILDEIFSLINDIPLDINSKKRKEIIQKIADLLTFKINILPTSEIKAGIKNILENDTNMPSRDVSGIASALVNRVKGMPLPETEISRQSSINKPHIRKIVKDGIDNILDDYGIPNSVEKNITDALTDQIVRGISNDDMNRQIKTILKDANVSKGDADEITDKLIKRNKEMFASYKSPDSTPNTSYPTLSPQEKLKLKQKINKTVLDFNKDITGEERSEIQNKRKNDTAQLAENLTEIMVNPNEQTKKDKENKIMREITQYLEKESFDTPETKKELAKRLKNLLETIDFKTSTPLKETKQFVNKRESSISTINNDTDYESDDEPNGRPKPQLIFDSEDEETESENDDNELYFFPKDYKPPAKERKSISKSLSAAMNYMQELIGVITPWIYSTSLNSNDDNFIETMADDLATNIVDTEKYLQQNNISQSNKEEVESLQNLISEWLNKFVIDENFPTESEIKALINEIRGVSRQRQRKQQNHRKDNQLKQQSNGKDNQRKQHSNGKDKELSKMGETKIELPSKNSSISDSESYFIRDYIDFTADTLKSALLDWLKPQEIYQDSLPKEKRIQENLIEDLGDRLYSIMEESPSRDINIDPILLNEIKKYLQKFPTNLKFKSNQKHMDGLAKNMLDYLKSLQLLANVSQNFDPSSINHRVDKWDNKVPLSRLDSFEKANLEALNNNLKDNVNETGLRDKAKLGKETKEFLENTPLEFKNVKDPKKAFNKLEDQLIDGLEDTVENEQILESNKFIEEGVEQWVKTLDLPDTGEGTLKDILTDAKQDLVTTLVNEISNADDDPPEKIDELFQDATRHFLEKVPEHPYMPEDINMLAKSLQDILNNLPGKYSTLPSESLKKKAADVLLDDIAKWVKNLPIESDTPEKKEEAENVKQQLETKLIHKIGELNMNPEVFNDNFLYEDMLGDEVDNLLANIPSKNVKNDQPRLKKELLDIVRKAREKIQEESAGQIYKHQLREMIAKTLPPFDLSTEGQALFELLKDDIADSFINMHYVGNNENEINKLKKEISDKIYKFCNDYLKRCPAIPLDTRQLTQDVFNALETITEPQNESFKNEVDLVKIKEVINNWAELLPLNEQTGQEQFQTNKMKSVLAKKLYDIENLRSLIPDRESDAKSKKEIIVFLKKLPLTTDKDEDINEFAEILQKNLKDTKNSRKLNASFRHSIQPKDFCSCYGSSIPPSTLSKEDQDHLERIRKRTPFVRRRISFKDVSLSPCSVNAGSQTEINSSSFGICPMRSQRLAQRNSSAQTPCRRMQAVGSQINESPYGNENRWHSNDGSYLQPPPAPCPFTPAPSCASIPHQLRRPISPTARSPCTSNRINRTCTPHLSQMQFNNPRGSQQRPYGSYYQTRAPCPEHQLPYRSTPCRPEQLPQAQAGIQRSGPVSSLPHPISDQNNSSQKTSQSCPHQLPYSYERISSRSENYPQRTEAGSQRRKYSPPSQKGSSQELSGHRNDGESHTLGKSCPEPAAQLSQRSRRTHQGNPRMCVASHSPLPSQGQSCLAPQSSVPCATPQPIRPEPRISSEDYEAGPSCSFQKRVTHLGSFDHVPCRQDHWEKLRNNCRRWERDGRCVISDEEHQERCRCKPKCGKYSGRRKPCHLHNDESMNSCSKCCGVHCPYPSYLFFR